MITDKFIVSEQINIQGDTATADISLQVKATGIGVSEAAAAVAKFDQFVADCRGKATRNATPWSSEERESIKDAPTGTVAWKQYHSLFPESHRKKKDVKRRWLALQAGKKKKEPASKPPAHIQPATDPADQQPAGTNPAAKPVQGKNDIQNWSTAELKVIEDCKDRTKVVAAYREKFPDSKRNDRAIEQRWYKLHPVRKNRAKKKHDVKKPKTVAVKEPGDPPDQKLPTGQDPVAPSPTGQKLPTGHKDGASGKGIRPGMAVRHNGPKASPFFGKEGRVIKVADDGQLCIRFESSSTWLPSSSVIAIADAPGGEGAACPIS